MTGHELRKSIWTEADFEMMGWHDARLYCFTVFPESFELCWTSITSRSGCIRCRPRSLAKFDCSQAGSTTVTLRRRSPTRSSTDPIN
jgi:hypothetical protein